MGILIAIIVNHDQTQITTIREAIDIPYTWSTKTPSRSTCTLTDAPAVANSIQVGESTPAPGVLAIIMPLPIVSWLKLKNRINDLTGKCLNEIMSGSTIVLPDLWDCRNNLGDFFFFFPLPPISAMSAANNNFLALSYIGMGEKYLDAPDFIQHAAFHSFFTPPSMIECPFTVMLDAGKSRCNLRALSPFLLDPPDCSICKTTKNFQTFRHCPKLTLLVIVLLRRHHHLFITMAIRVTAAIAHHCCHHSWLRHRASHVTIVCSSCCLGHVTALALMMLATPCHGHVTILILKAKSIYLLCNVLI